MKNMEMLSLNFIQFDIKKVLPKGLRGTLACLMLCIPASMFILPSQAQTLPLPIRSPHARPATLLIQEWQHLDRETLEKRLFEEISSGNVPPFLRQLSEIKDSVVINDRLYSIRYYCTPDYLAVGSNTDYLLIPMSAYLAQELADETQTNLPTAKMVDQIYSAASIKLRPQPIPPSPEMITLPVFIRHQQLIRGQCDSLGISAGDQLIAGHKKDIILSNKIYEQLRASVPNPVVIYGWHTVDGSPIQPVYNGHGATYADYSHGIRLIQNKVWVNGKPRAMKRILASKKWHSLLSNEGQIRKFRYPKSPL